MNKLSWGSIAIILGSIVLSLEFYGLTWYAKAMSFEHESFFKYNTFIKYSVGIMYALIMYGIILVVLHFMQEHRNDKLNK